jgi:microcin C transport system permease protein
MYSYFIRRLLLTIPTFIGITLLVFCITRMVPGGPIEQILTESMFVAGDQASQSSSLRGNTLSESQINDLKVYYGFDKPILVSYYEWLKKILTFDLGISTRYNSSVWELIKERLPISSFYGLTTLILTYAICIPLGIRKALKHGGNFDHISSAIVFIGYALPGYVIGIALLTAFSSYLEWFPLGGFVSDDFDDFTLWQKTTDIIYHSILPLIAYMSGSFAITTFMMKNALMDNLSSDYVRTAIAKGRNFTQAVRHHALRNSLIPIATSFGGNISFMLSGSFLIETIFNIDGFGLLGYESILERDYPVVMGILVISSVLFLLGNIISDICVALVDPRVQFGDKTS